MVDMLQLGMERHHLRVTYHSLPLSWSFDFEAPSTLPIAVETNAHVTGLAECGFDPPDTKQCVGQSAGQGVGQGAGQGAGQGGGQG